MTLGCSCHAYSAAALLHRDVVQPPVFVTATLQKKLKKIAHSSLLPGLVAARRSSRYKTSLAKHRICVLSTTRNVGPRFWFEYGFLVSVYAPPFFSCPTAWNRTLLWLFDTCGFPAQLLALHREISTTRWLHENFVVPFLHILSPLDSWETNVCAGRIDLHLKFVISHRSATRFRIRKVRWKHFMMNILAAFHFA